MIWIQRLSTLCHNLEGRCTESCVLTLWRRIDAQRPGNSIHGFLLTIDWWPLLRIWDTAYKSRYIFIPPDLLYLLSERGPVHWSRKPIKFNMRRRNSWYRHGQSFSFMCCNRRMVVEQSVGARTDYRALSEKGALMAKHPGTESDSAKEIKHEIKDLKKARASVGRRLDFTSSYNQIC